MRSKIHFKALKIFPQGIDHNRVEHDNTAANIKKPLFINKLCKNKR